MAEINDILQEISDYGVRSLNILTRSTSFTDVKLLTVEGEQEPECLYVGNAGDITKTDKKIRGGIFLLVSDNKALPEEFVKNNTVILAEMVQNVETLFDTCLQWLSDYSKYLEASDHIIQVFLDSQEEGLELLADETARLLKNPLIVLDANCKILASSNSYEVEDEIWKQNLARGYCTYEQIIELKGPTEDKKTEQEKGFQIVSSSFYRNRLCISRLQTSEEQMGMLIVFEVSTPFSRMDRKFLNRAAGLMTVLIHRNYERQRTLNEYSEDNIFIECLSGELKSYASYLERVRNTPFHNPSCYRVILIDVEHFENFDPRKEVLRSYFAKLFCRSWMLWYHGNVVSIVDVSDSEDIRAVLAKGDDFFQEKRLRLGISDIFENIYYIEQYYRQGITALKLAKKLQPGEYLSFYNQYKFYDMLQVIVKQSGAEGYLDGRLLNILEYDRKNHTEYYHTIGTYIFSGQNLARAAEALHVHKNTVSYRISKAKSLFSLSFENVEEVFGLMYSYKMKQIMRLHSKDEDEKKNGAYQQDFLC